MPDLTFQVREASAAPFAASPTIALELAIRSADAGGVVRGVALRCQVWIEAQRRRYTAEEQGALSDLFGAPGLWERSLRPLLWTHASVMVPPFTEEAIVELPLPCTYDLTVASARYFHGLSSGGGDAPLLLSFSGTIFHEPGGGALQVAPLSWSKEVRASLPARVFRQMQEHYYPSGFPLLLRRDVIDRLHRYRARHGFSTWEQAMESLLSPAEEGEPR